MASKTERRESKSRAFSDISPDELADITDGYPHAVRQQISVIKTGLKRRQLSGAQPCAKATVEVLRNVLGNLPFKNAKEMMLAVRVVGKELSNAAPAELTVGNITRRVLYMIREEYNGKKRAAEATLPTPPETAAASTLRARALLASTDSLGELSDETAFLSDNSEVKPPTSDAPSPRTPTSHSRPIMPTSRPSSSSFLTLTANTSFSKDLSSTSYDKDSQQPSLTRSLSMGSTNTDAPEDYALGEWRSGGVAVERETLFLCSDC